VGKLTCLDDVFLSRLLDTQSFAGIRFFEYILEIDLNFSIR
jgi:hypothetical protein